MSNDHSDIALSQGNTTGRQADTGMQEPVYLSGPGLLTPAGMA
jgi:hypothetical protein